ncbi:hypothetical protein Ancab_023103 [Ancistrocladus abbreviatus]
MRESTANFHDIDSDLSRIKEFLFGPETEANNDLLDACIADPDNPFNESWLLDGFNTTATTTGDVPNMYDSQDGTSERGGGEKREKDFGNPLPLQEWPCPPVPYACSRCQVLREIIHLNGSDQPLVNWTHTAKLEIHGGIGFISHAILDNLYASESHRDYQMLDFCPESIEGVKNFLKNYLQERKLSGYTLLQDNFSSFYEAICVGFDWLNNHPDALNHHFYGNYTDDDGLGNLGSYQTCQGEASNHSTREHDTGGQPEGSNCMTGGFQLNQLEANNISSDPLKARNQAEASNCRANPSVPRNEESLRDNTMANAIVIRDQAGAWNTTTNPVLVRNHAEGNKVWPDPPVTWNQVTGSNAGRNRLDAAENLKVIENRAGDSNAAASPVEAVATTFAQRRPKSYAEQRAKAKELTYEQVAEYFHLPLKEAANVIGLAETTVKKIAHLGISRWPYRDVQVKRIRRQMSLLQRKSTSAYEPEREQAQAQIRRLEQELLDIRSGNIPR